MVVSSKLQRGETWWVVDMMSYIMSNAACIDCVDPINNFLTLTLALSLVTWYRSLITHKVEQRTQQS